MRRVITTIAIGIGLAVSSWTGRAEAKNPECRFGIGERAMRQTIWCVAHKLGEDAAFRRTALYIASRESGFYAGATNPYSGAAGIYQHLPSYWPGRYAAHSPRRFSPMAPGVYSGRSNIIVSLLMASRNGWGPWAI